MVGVLAAEAVHHVLVLTEVLVRVAELILLCCHHCLLVHALCVMKKTSHRWVIMFSCDGVTECSDASDICITPVAFFFSDCLFVLKITVLTCKWSGESCWLPYAEYSGRCLALLRTRRGSREAAQLASKGVFSLRGRE